MERRDVTKGGVTRGEPDGARKKKKKEEKDETYERIDEQMNELRILIRAAIERHERME